MIAPHSLALHGNLAGQWGLLMPLGLISAAVIYLLLLRSRHDLPAADGLLRAEAGLYRAQWGVLPAQVLPLAGRLLAVLAGATGLLVTAGFAFNEIFLYWFPNFAFAFLLLGLVLLLQLAGRRWYRSAQLCFTAITLAGLVLLTAIALGMPGEALQADGDPAPSGLFAAWAPMLLLFVGFELAFLDRDRHTGPPLRTTAVGIVAAALVHILWGWAAIRHLPLDRLTDTTIAPILVAKQAWGQAGRYTMGMVTIAGALAAVNALFSLVAATYEGGRPLHGTGAANARHLPKVVVTLLAITVAALMATGMAGTDGIDVALRAGLILWLLHYALVPLLQHGSGWPASLAGVGTLFGALTLGILDPHRGLLLICMLAALGGTALVTADRWWPRWAYKRERSPQ